MQTLKMERKYLGLYLWEQVGINEKRQGNTEYQKTLLAVNSRARAKYSGEFFKLFKNNLKNTNKQATRSKSLLAEELVGLHSLLYPHFFLCLVYLLPINNVQHLVKAKKK